MKERVIGAIALVAIAVLVVPVFLDGPSTDAEIVSESVTLPGQNEQARKRQTIVLERDRDQPVPATRNTAATTAAEKLAADAAARKAESEERPPAATAGAAPEPLPQSPPQEKPASQPQPQSAQAESGTQVAKAEAKTGPQAAEAQSATGMWAVQLGSFSNQANAERLAADLRSNGYAAFLSQLKTTSGSLHRVRVGPQKDRDSAEAVASKLGGDGHKGQVVPHP